MDKQFTILFAEKQTAAYNDLKGILNATLEIGKHYDGKVINKRFFDAINQIISKDVVKVANSTILRPKGKIGFYPYGNKDIFEVDLYNGRFDYCNQSRKIEDSVHLCKYKGVEYIVNKRLVFSALESSINATIDYINCRIAKLQNLVAKFDEYEAKLNKINGELREIESSLQMSGVCLTTTSVVMRRF